MYSEISPITETHIMYDPDNSVGFPISLVIIFDSNRTMHP